MKKFKLDNGLKFIYKYKEGSISSFCIGFNAGASVEEESDFGLAHLLEHMVFKGTKKRTEDEINKQFDSIFGFFNAMTNYPYVIYYGTTLSEDLEKGIELYSDILLNPIFPKNGFTEEVNVVVEELKEWKEDSVRFCEDELLKNSFRKKRIRERIIGCDDKIRSFNLRNIKDFYNKYYLPDNCVISVVSSLEFDYIYEIISEYFSKWQGNLNKNIGIVKEKNISGIYTYLKSNITMSRILYGYSLDFLTYNQIETLKIIDSVLAKGVSSIIYDQLRTINGIAYDVISTIKREPAINLYTIGVNVSAENIDKSIKLINMCIENIKKDTSYFRDLKVIIKRIKLKEKLGQEKTIEISKELAVRELLFNDLKEEEKDFDRLESITVSQITETANLVLQNPSIQIIAPFNS